MAQYVKKYGVVTAAILLAVFVGMWVAPTRAYQSGSNVQGGTAAGTTDNQYPVDVGGQDSNGKLQHMKVATDGTVQIGGSVTATVSAPPNPCDANQIQSAPFTISSATTTQILAPSGSTTVTICGYSVTMSATLVADTFLLEYGSGATCGTGTTVVTGTISSGVLTTGATSVSHPVPLKSSASGQGICAVTTVGTGPSIAGVVSFVQI